MCKIIPVLEKSREGVLRGRVERRRNKVQQKEARGTELLHAEGGGRAPHLPGNRSLLKDQASSNGHIRNPQFNKVTSETGPETERFKLRATTAEEEQGW